MTWVLIVWLVAGAHTPVVVGEYKTGAQCDASGRLFKSTAGLEGYARAARYVCVPKA